MFARNFDVIVLVDDIGEFIKWNQEQIVFCELPSQCEGWKIASMSAPAPGAYRFHCLKREQRKLLRVTHPLKCWMFFRRKSIIANLKFSLRTLRHLDFPDQVFRLRFKFSDAAACDGLEKSTLGALQGFERLGRFLIFLRNMDFSGWRRYFTGYGDSFRAMFKITVLFRLQEVLNELEKHGFDVVSVDPGFFLPLVVYRKIRQ